jgi:hypothetical protein
MPRRTLLPTSVMSASVERFNHSVAKFTKGLTGDRFFVFYKRLSFQVLRDVVFLTPVDTGRAKGNWQLTIGSPSDATFSVDEANARDPVAEGFATLNSLQGLDVVWISNNMPYIGYLERGSSKNAPQGMVTLTLNHISEGFEQGEGRRK